MSTIQYGETQVCEIHLDRQDVIRLVIENVKMRADPSYDFDNRNPIILDDGSGGFVIRYVQKKITEDSPIKPLTLMPLNPKHKRGSSEGNTP